MDQERKEFMRLLPLHPECYPALRRILDPSSTGKEGLESAPVSPFQGAERPGA